MASPDVVVARADDARPPAETSPGELVARLAWLLALPVALAAVLFGWVVFPDPVTDPARLTGNPDFFETVYLAPEPGDRLRYALGLLAPIALAIAVALAYARPRLRRLVNGDVAVRVVVAIQLGVVLFGLWCLGRQDPGFEYFGLTDVVIAAGVTIGAVVVWRRNPRLRLPGSRTVQALVAYVVCGVVAGSYLLTNVVTDGGIGNTLGDTQFHVPPFMGEFTSFANGRTPLVDFVPQYTNLLPWLVGPWLDVTDERISTYSLSMVALSALGLLAVLVVLRSLAGSAVTAAALFLPFVGLTFLRAALVGAEYANIGLYYAVMPMRYVGPWLALAACLPYLRRPSRWTLVLASAAAGLVAVNNLDWGIPALGGVGACLWCGDERTASQPWRTAGRLGAALAAGVAGALVLVTALTLLRTGSLPDFSLALEFPLLFGESGFLLLPVPGVAPYLALYLTFAAAIGVAVGRACLAPSVDARRRVADGALAFGGIFGLGAFAYYMGRSHPFNLYALFGIWAFVIVVLAHEGARAAWRGRMSSVWVVPTLAAVALFGLAAATVREMPLPWRQVDRITTGGAAVYDMQALTPFVREHTTDGEKVAILSIQSHRIAEAAGVTDVSPFNSVNAMASFDQLDLLIERIDDEDVDTVFARDVFFPEITDALADAGFELETTDPDTGWQLWTRAG